MANTLKLTDELVGLGVFNKTVSFRSPLQLPRSDVVRLRVSRVQVSDRIPNVLDARPFGVNFNNSTVRVGTDIHGYVTIALETGLYLEVSMIAAAINAAVATLGWWLNPSDPGFTMTVNPIIDRFLVTLNSAKLAPAHGAQLLLDLSEAPNSSQMWRTLGFKPTTSFIADGTYTSNDLPLMETQGTSCIVCCSVMPPRLVNDTYLPYAADVSFTGKLTSSDNVWPPGNVGNDQIVYNGSRTITQATLYVLTESGAPMVFMGGRLSIEMLFY